MKKERFPKIFLFKKVSSAKNLYLIFQKRLFLSKIFTDLEIRFPA